MSLEQQILNTTTTPNVVKKKRGFGKFIFITSLISILVGSLLVYWFCYNVYSSGERSGTFMKLSNKGNIFKTNEGEIQLGVVSQGGMAGITTEKFYFSVENNAIVDTLNSNQGKRITVDYKEYRRSLPWRGESTYIVTGVKKIEN
jgi:hypothetical protein